MMYAEFYNLKAMPFQLTPDCQFFFESEEHKRAFAHLVYGLAQEEGFIIITGEIGAGKTMLVERLWSQLDIQKFVAVRVSTTNVSGDDLLKLLAGNLGLPAEAADKATLLRRLEQLFNRTITAGKRCLLVIDEVQNLPFTALEELRMLSNTTIQGRAPFQCLLLGQPQFRQMLTDVGLEQLEQRVLASYHLGPLSPPDTQGYVQHRLRTAGWSGDPSFEDAAFIAIHRHSSGIPRKINTLCSRALLAGYLEETHIITEKMLNNLADELERDLVGGRAASPIPTDQRGDFGQMIDGRLRSLEQSVARHDRVLKRTLEITARLLIETGT
jgi:putative secretion ATPase (PEP-CTERM system associated)